MKAAVNNKAVIFLQMEHLMAFKFMPNYNKIIC